MATSILSSLSLFPATPEQTLESRRRTHEEWGKAITLEEYLARDDFTDKTDVARDGKLITWVLAPRNDRKTLEFVSSCETFRRDGLVCSRSATDGKFKKVVCYGVASVFTPTRFRGKGFAAHMMHLLHWVLAETKLLPAEFPNEWGAPPDRVASAGDGWFSTLWSDVGPNFYKRCGPTIDQDGWIVRDPVSTTWDVVQDNVVPASDCDRDWTLLDETGVMKLWENDAENIMRTISLTDSYQAGFSFLPYKGVAAFQFWRNNSILAKYCLPIQHWGITGDPNTFATWTFEIRSTPKTLLITRLNCSPPDFEILLGKIISIARTLAMDKVEVYNLSNELQPIAKRLGGTTFNRDEHLSAFKWYGTEESSEIAWLLNER